MELIKHAACKAKHSEMIFIGKCHGDCFHKAHHVNTRLSQAGQGFLTSLGRFVDRAEAGEIAHKAGQIDSPNSFLFSEDLWSKQYKGKHNYCEIKGYITPDQQAEPETME